MTPREACRVVDVDGVPVRVRGSGKPLIDRDREALAELVAAVRRRMDEEPPEVQLERAVRQQAALERIRGVRADVRDQD